MVFWPGHTKAAGAQFDMTHRNRAIRARPYDEQVYGSERITPLDIAAMLRVVWHGKMLIVCATLLVAGLAAYYAFRMATPQYAATATLHLEGPTRPLGSAQQMPGLDDAQLNTKIALVTSDPVLNSVVIERGLLSDPEFNRYLSLQRPFALHSLRTTIRHALAGTSEQPPDAAAVLVKTIQNLRAKLTVARHPDTYILQITARSADPDKATQLANTTARTFLAHMQLRDAEAQAEAELWLQSRINALRTELETQEMQVAALIATAQIQQDRGLDTLSAQVLAANQDLIEARNTLAALEIAPQSGSPRHTAEMTQRRAVVAAFAALKERLSAQLSDQSAGLAQLHQVQLQLDANRQLYQTFLARLHENQMQQGLVTPYAQRMTPAANSAYIGPQKILILTIATILGATLGVMAVALRHVARKGVIDASSLRDATGIPVLAQFSTRALRRLRKGPRSFPVPQSELLGLAHGLCTALSLRSQQQPQQIIRSTSSIQGEGKTENAILLAHVLAKSGKRVALVTADESDQFLGSILGQDVLAKARQNWQLQGTGVQSPALGADLLLMVAADDSPILSNYLVAELQALRATYDHIIIDGPPVLRGVQAALIASYADAIIYAVRWSKTPLEVVARGLSALEEVDCPATGLVLSKVNLRKMRKLSQDPYINAMQTA